MTSKKTMAWRRDMVIRPITMETIAPRRIGISIQKNWLRPPAAPMAMPATAVLPVKTAVRSVQLTLATSPREAFEAMVDS